MSAYNATEKWGEAQAHRSDLRALQMRRTQGGGGLDRGQVLGLEARPRPPRAYLHDLDGPARQGRQRQAGPQDLPAAFSVRPVNGHAFLRSCLHAILLPKPCSRQDLNLWPRPSQDRVLSAELREHYICFTRLAGIEPAIFSSTERRVDHSTTAPPTVPERNSSTRIRTRANTLTVCHAAATSSRIIRTCKRIVTAGIEPAIHRI